jgi:hypothetical protein
MNEKKMFHPHPSTFILKLSRRPVNFDVGRRREEDSMKVRRSMSLIITGGVIAAFAQIPVGAKERQVEVVGTVVGVVGPRGVISGLANKPCDDRLLFRIARGRGSFRAGEYLVLQYDRPPYPCELPEEMFSGQIVWKFKLNKEASGKGSLRKMLPIWELTGDGETRAADTLHGRVTLSRYGNLTMLDGGRIEDLPLDAVVGEFKFGPRDYKRVGRAKNSPLPNKRLQPTPR